MEQFAKFYIGFTVASVILPLLLFSCMEASKAVGG